MLSAPGASSITADSSRFQFTGGLLERAFYVQRPADRLLPEALLAGDYCHILAPRQIGKTSLCFRTARELARRGVRCALVDVTAAGTPSTTEEWYFGLVDEIARRLKLPDPLDVWQKRSPVAPAQRFRDYVRALVEDDPDGAPLVIFLDEIEMVRLAPVDVDDFLLILRSFHEERGQSPALRRLTFCLIGVTTPNDLIKNKSVTPFNVSKPIRVDDFTRAECDALAPGLEGLDADIPAVLDAVYAWTDGHPYMTMRACFELARRGKAKRGEERAAVDEIVRELFLERPLEDTNLNYAARRFEDAKFDRDGARLAEKIQLYRTVLQHKDPPAHNESSVQMELRICGMVKDVEVAPGKRVLRPRSRIYETALDAEWLRSKGDRRFFGEAVWKWIDAGKDEAALLRGVVLERALAWAKTNVLSEDEQAFLDASQRHATVFLETQRQRITQEVAIGEAVKKATDEDLARVREDLAKVMEEKDAAESARAELEEKQERLKATMGKTRALLYLLFVGLVAAVIAAGVLVRQAHQETNRARDAAALEDQRAREAADQNDKLERQATEYKNQIALLQSKEDQELKEKAQKMKALDDAITQKQADFDKLKKDSEVTLATKAKQVAELNAYLGRSPDAADAISQKQACEATLSRCQADRESLRAQLPGITTARVPPPKNAEDPY
ncbi:MAG: AAA-like domain-containing protein [Polyangiaceae bacterium]